MATIMVIDDNKVMSLFIRRCLEKEGYGVEEWLPLSALEIPDHLRNSAPDLIISDYFMPGFSGASVARIAMDTIPNIPVIILTVLRDEEFSARLLHLGVKAVLNKPIKPEKLALEVGKALARPE